VTNVVMTDVLCPFTMNLYYAPGAWGDAMIADKRPHPVTGATPRFRRIHLSHLTARNARVAAAFLYGLAEMPLEDVELSDVSVAMAADAEPGYADMADDLEPMRRAGLFARNARGLRLHRVEVGGQIGPALSIEDSADVEISACAARTPPADGPAVRLRNVEGAFVHGCRAGAGGVFLHLEGERTRDVVLRGNSLARAAQPLLAASDVPPGAFWHDQRTS
jgi:hypothetical protein